MEETVSGKLQGTGIIQNFIGMRVPIIRIRVYQSLHRGPFIYGNYNNLALNPTP